MMLAQRVFGVVLAALGAAAIGISVGVFLAGPQVVAGAIVSALALFGFDGGKAVGLSSTDIDNEMRFYSVLWFTYGVIAIRAARALPSSLFVARILFALFFAGGIGRAISMVTVGTPHPLFVLLMWIELLVAPALLLLSWRIPAPKR